MNAVAWYGRIGLPWSVTWMSFCIYQAVTGVDPFGIVFQSTCAVIHLAGVVVCLRGLLTELRRRELLRKRRVLSLRGLACYTVFADRIAPGNPREDLADSALDSATQAYEELVLVRLAMGEPA